PRRFELDRRKGRRIGADGQAAAGLRPDQGALHVGDRVGMSSFHEFVATAQPPAEARATAARAFLDTIGVTYAGAVEPAARAVQRVVEADSPGPCAVVGTSLRASAGNAALANGTAAHALDYDDMCFVSLAHPSAPLVAAAWAAAEIAGA